MPIDQWLILALTCGAAIVGLFIAASNNVASTYGIGLALFVVAVGYAFYLIKRYFDRTDQMRH